MLKWSEDYKIGVLEIDNEHKEIITRFEKLYSLMREGSGHEYYSEILIFLDDYINTHFSHEESLQLKINYPDYEHHRSIHKAFSDAVVKMTKTKSNVPVTNDDLIKLNLFVKNWLLNHILIEDKKIGEFLKNTDIPD